MLLHSPTLVHPHRRLLHLLLVGIALSPAWLRADWADAVGYTALKTELGAALPTGNVAVTQVEAEIGPTGYAAVGGSGTVFANNATFVNKTFVLKSGPAAVSFHAYEVGQQIYGTAPASPRYGMAPGATNVDAYEVNDWLEVGFLNLSGGNPLGESSQVQNHSWIYLPTLSSEEPDMIEILRRFDNSITNSNYVACVGMANDGSSTVPVLMATAANVLSVGLTSGGHSRGLTASPYDIPGRTKPEIVAPSDFTSFGTGMVSGAAALLRSAATTNNARRNETLRAILLAGATKAEFPNWSRTISRPLDPAYGAGELNVAHSYHILTAGEQTASSTIPVALTGWELRNLAAGTNYDYLLEIPSSLQGASLSVVVVWNRSISRDSFQDTWTADPLPNLGLTLYQGTATSGPPLDTSDSAVDNLEHIWQPALKAGTYRMRLSGDLAVEAAIAWRVTAAPFPPTMVSGGLDPNQTITFQLRYLVPSQLYEIQSTADLSAWQTEQTFTASALTQSWISPVLIGPKRFFRLKWVCPAVP